MVNIKMENGFDTTVVNRGEVMEKFSSAWMKQLQDRWNAATDITTPLASAGFSARIGYGFKDEQQAIGMLVIKNGIVVDAGDYDGGALDWDLRATPEKWMSWMEEGFGLTKLGPAVATGSLQFVSGNYRQMIRNPALANPFMNHFQLMQEIG
jgi:hypothetical protein